ncbi:MAG: zinc-ribbon domain-containing protein [Chloroflexi bacterium]|nr:zinc-ribbon domain-containing protein [Chloroflexota bacterium]
MTCASCGHENVSGAQFCSQCGSRLGGPVQASPYRPFGSERPEHARGDLPPKELGGLISETFGVYSSSLWPFALIAAIPVVPAVVSIATPVWLTVILTIVFWMLTLLAYPAIAYGVALHYLGQEVNVSLCFRRAWNRVVSLIIANLILLVAVIGCLILFLVVIGIPLLFYIFVSWFFFGQAIILEGKGPTASIGRSRELVKGSWWRVFGLGVGFVLVMLMLFVGALIVIAAAVRAHPTAGQIVAGVFEIFLFPIAPIGATLVYFDLRVRKEGYSLDTMATEAGVAPAGM